MITLSGGTTSLSVMLAEYQAAWKAFLVVHHLERLEHVSKPTTLSWKVENKVSLYANLRSLGDLIEQAHIGTVDARFIVSAVLHEPFQGLYIVKILERRPASTDRLGLDSIDYLASNMKSTYELLKSAGAHVTREHNDHHKWLSLRFGKNLEYEAKFTDHLVLGVAAREMAQANARITGLL